MLAPAITLLALSTLISASTIDLPVVIRTTYSSVKFAIGSPPQDHHLLFDTGSASAWIVNTACTATSCPDGNTAYKRQKYNASASLTAVDLGVDAAIPYLGGDVAGQAYQDVFAIPGSDIEWNQTFLSANKRFSSIAVNATATLVETLLWKGALDAPRFSLFYGTNLDDQGPQDGVLTIGGSHEEKYADGEVVYTPLKKRDEYQLWRAALRSVNVLVAHNPNSTVEIRNGRLPTIALPEGALPKANTTLPVNGSAVFDTGAGRLSVPAEIVGTMYSNLGWNVTKLLNGQERMSCQHLNASWAVTLTLGEGAEEDDVSFTVRGDEFTVPGAQCMPPFDDSGSRGFALVGAAFLRRHYSVFDFGGDKVESYQPRLGFARLKKDYDYLYQ